MNPFLFSGFLLFLLPSLKSHSLQMEGFEFDWRCRPLSWLRLVISRCEWVRVPYPSNTDAIQQLFLLEILFAFEETIKVILKVLHFYIWCNIFTLFFLKNHRPADKFYLNSFQIPQFSIMKKICSVAFHLETATENRNLGTC